MKRVKGIQNYFRNLKESSPERVARFFKAQPGEYGEHDRFLGVTMPTIRKYAKENHDLTHSELQKLLQSPYNEERCLALVILGDLYEKRTTTDAEREVISKFYQSNFQYVNNWNLVDISAYRVFGEHLVRTTGVDDLTTLLNLAKSTNLWERRISIVSTLAFIRNRQYQPTLTISECLLHDSEDLIHKACGWMLREMGKKDIAPLKAFLTNMQQICLERCSATRLNDFPHQKEVFIDLKKLFLKNWQKPKTEREASMTSHVMLAILHKRRIKNSRRR